MAITPRARSFRLAVCCSRLVRPVSRPISASDLYTQPSRFAPLSERTSNWLRKSPVGEQVFDFLPVVLGFLLMRKSWYPVWPVYILENCGNHKKPPAAMQAIHL